MLSLHYKGDNSYLLVNGKEIYKVKEDNKNVNFLTQFCLGSISCEFDAFESREASLKGTAFVISIDYNAIDISDKNIQIYLMVKNNLKWWLGLLKTCLSDY